MKPKTKNSKHKKQYVAGWLFVASLLIVLALLNFPVIFAKPGHALSISATDKHAYSIAESEETFRTADIVTLLQGENLTMALTRDGNVYAAGDNRYGQLGLGTFGANQVKMHQVLFPDGVVIKQLDLKHNHAVALSTKNEMWAWGMNISGQIGNNSRTSVNKPVKVLDDVKDIAAGYRFSAAIRSSGELWAWGMNCDPATPNLDKLLIEFAKDVSVGGTYYNGVSQSAATYCLEEKNLPIASLMPKRVPTDMRFATVSGGYGHIVMTDDQQRAWSFGCNAWGQLGRGNTRNDGGARKITRIAFPENVKVSTIDAGFRHTVALDTDGKVWTWGHDLHGDEVQYKMNRNDVPEQQKTTNKVTSIVAGHDETGVIINGAGYVAGDNDQGQISQAKARDGHAALSTFTKITNNNIQGLSVGYLRQLYW